MNKETDDVERAVDEVLKVGFGMPDIYTEGTKLISGSQMRDEIISRL